MRRESASQLAMFAIAAATTVLVTLFVMVVSLTVAEAQLAMQPITIIGYFDRTNGDDSAVTREIQISIDGRSRRPFGIVGAQSRVGTAATDIFRASLRPVVLIRGRDEMRAQLDAASSTQKVTIIGMFDARSTAINLNRVEVAPEASADGSGEGPAGDVPGE